MSRWTELVKIAEGGSWFEDSLNYEGPSCYELIIAGPRTGEPEIVYVGETQNEKARIISHARGDSHLSEHIYNHLSAGWSFCFRSQAMPSKEAAKAMQDRLLANNHYPWNSTAPKH